MEYVLGRKYGRIGLKVRKHWKHCLLRFFQQKFRKTLKTHSLFKVISTKNLNDIENAQSFKCFLICCWKNIKKTVRCQWFSFFCWKNIKNFVFSMICFFLLKKPLKYCVFSMFFGFHPNSPEKHTHPHAMLAQSPGVQLRLARADALCGVLTSTSAGYIYIYIYTNKCLKPIGGSCVPVRYDLNSE